MDPCKYRNYMDEMLEIIDEIGCRLVFSKKFLLKIKKYRNNEIKK